MNNLQKAFLAHRNQRAQAPSQPLTAQEGLSLLLRQHLQKLMSADHQAAREAMEMSQEQAPELFQVAQSQPPSQWVDSLMNSDSMHSLMSRNPSQVKALLEIQDLRSLLEMLP